MRLTKKPIFPRNNQPLFHNKKYNGNQNESLKTVSRNITNAFRQDNYQKAEKIFNNFINNSNQTGIHPDTRLFNTMIIAFKKKPDKALKYLNKLIQRKLVPDRYTYGSIIKNLTNAVDEKNYQYINVAIKIHEDFKSRYKLNSDLTIYQHLLIGLRKTKNKGYVIKAENLFDEWNRKSNNKISEEIYKEMIAIYGMNEQGVNGMQKAFNIYSKIWNDPTETNKNSNNTLGFPKDSKILCALIQACKNEGTQNGVKKALDLFEGLDRYNYIDTRILSNTIAAFACRSLDAQLYKRGFDKLFLSNKFKLNQIDCGWLVTATLKKISENSNENEKERYFQNVITIIDYMIKQGINPKIETLNKIFDKLIIEKSIAMIPKTYKVLIKASLYSKANREYVKYNTASKLIKDMMMKGKCMPTKEFLGSVLPMDQNEKSKFLSTLVSVLIDHSLTNDSFYDKFKSVYSDISKIMNENNIEFARGIYENIMDNKLNTSFNKQNKERKQNLYLLLVEAMNQYEHPGMGYKFTYDNSEKRKPTNFTNSNSKKRKSCIPEVVIEPTMTNYNH